MSLNVPTSEDGDGTFSGILWTYDLNGNEPVCRHATINDRAHLLGRDECFAYNAERSEVGEGDIAKVELRRLFGGGMGHTTRG